VNYELLSAYSEAVRDNISHYPREIEHAHAIFTLVSYEELPADSLKPFTVYLPVNPSLKTALEVYSANQETH
jgi:hypothetical protein